MNWKIYIDDQASGTQTSHKLLYVLGIVAGIKFLCPQGDSNSCLGLERAPSWATRRWGRLFIWAGEIVSFHSSIVNEKDVQFAGAVHANGEGHLDVRGAGRTGDHNRGSCLMYDRQSHSI
jgi:hypothetical protein